MSQPPTRDGWLEPFLAEARPGEVVVSARLWTADAVLLLRASARLSRLYSLSACWVRWRPDSECYWLLLAMVAPSVSLFTTERSVLGHTPPLRRSLLKHLSRYAPVQELKLLYWVDMDQEEVKSALDEPS